MRTDIRYDGGRPLMQAEKGNLVIIRVHGENKKNVPCGTYEGVYQGNYRITCEAEPRLNGTYTYWRGQKWGDGWIFADLKQNWGGSKDVKL